MKCKWPKSLGLGRSPVAPTFRDMPHYVPQKGYAG
jgi:hypothetical protein